MNLPAGKPVKTAIDVATVDFVALLNELIGKSFNGYLCITIQGAGGIEDGELVFENGKIVISSYEYLKHGKTLLGEAAFVRAINASAAQHGVIDIYQLTLEQVELVLAFNENAIFVPNEKDLKNLKITTFSTFFEEQVKTEEKTVTRSDLMKKYRLEDLHEGKAEPGPDETSEDEELLSEIVKQGGE